MVESIPEKDQFLIAYPNYVLRETVTYPNGGVSRFYDDGVDMVIIDDEICSCRDGEQIFPYTLITDKQNHYMKIYRRVLISFDLGEESSSGICNAYVKAAVSVKKDGRAC